MTESEEHIEQQIEQHQDEAPDVTPSARRGVGLVTVLGLSLLAGLGGAAGGWALTHYVYPPKMQVTDIAPLSLRVERAEAQLKTQLSKLKILQAAPTSAGTSDIEALLRPIAERLSALEASPQPEVQPNFDISRDIYPDNSSNVSREMIGQIEVEIGGQIEAQIDVLRARITKLEADMPNALNQAARNIAATPQTVTQAITKTITQSIRLPEFPRAAMLAAMTAPRDTAQQGWLGRTLKKHISVRNPDDVARANTTLDEIQALIKAADYTAAFGLIETLPSQVRSVAKPWTDAVRTDAARIGETRRNVETERSDD